MKFLIGALLMLQAVGAFGQTALDQHRRLIKGRWDWCQGIGKLDSLGRPTPGSNYAGWKYVFYANGRFTEFPTKHKGSKRKHSGTWKLTAEALTLDTDDAKGYTTNPYTRPVHWLSDDMFYTTGLEGERGMNVFSYFKRRGSKKEHG